MILEILVAPDSRLKEVATPIENVTDEVRETLDNMLETMYAAPGVGLAAPQVGILKRMIVIDVDYAKEEGQKNPYKIINPEIVWTSEETSIYQEGCLSVPEYFDDVERPEKCRVEALNENGEKITIEADGLLATCIQHEIDHLNGLLFVDHLSRLKKSRALNKLEKLKKRGVKFHNNTPISENL